MSFSKKDIFKSVFQLNFLWFTWYLFFTTHVFCTRSSTVAWICFQKSIWLIFSVVKTILHDVSNQPDSCNEITANLKVTKKFTITFAGEEFFLTGSDECILCWFVLFLCNFMSIFVLGFNPNYKSRIKIVQTLKTDIKIIHELSRP